MKKLYIMATTACLALLLFAACDDQLDVTNYTKQNTSNFPATKSDVVKELNGAYSTMNSICRDPLQNPYFVNDIMSDDQNGAGGTGDVECHAISDLMTNKEALYDSLYANVYRGVFRSATVIYGIDNFKWGADSVARDQYLGEAYFLRALYYLWGTQAWGDIPAYWSAAVPAPCPQQSAENTIYPHIFADLVTASSLMTQKTQGDGHATKYAAEALLARAYMFYEGFYKKSGELATANLAAVTLPEQEGCKGVSLTKSMVVSALKDVIDNGGYKLVGDFRDLWQYTNPLTVGDYKYTTDSTKNASGVYVKTVKTGTDGKTLAWAGNGNSEQIFQIQFMNAASWNGTVGMGYCNQAELYQGLRCDADAKDKTIVNGGTNTYPFGQGWGQGTVTNKIWKDWSDTDLRKRASILNTSEELSQFAYTSSCTEETGLYNKKMLPVTCMKGYDGTTSTGTNWSNHTARYTWWACLQADYVNTNGDSFQGDHFGDLVLIRLADVLLMATELTGDAQYMNQVRARVGLDALTYSLENVKLERRHELAFEGLRFNDLRRWSGIDGGESCEAALALENTKEGQVVNYIGNVGAIMKHPASSWAKRYAATNGFLPIPPKELKLVNDETVLKQNAGWGSSVSDANLSGTPVYK